MCGLFGAIGKDIDASRVRALAIANRGRGKDSLGFFDSSGKVVKQAGDPCEVLGREDVTQFIAHTDRWFIAGHTRAATRGEVKRRNAHPFKYGNILGSHNGMVKAPAEFAVDSMYIFHRLNKCKGDYQRALEDISGYWSLTWFDGDSLFVQMHNNTLWFAKIGETFYYSSTKVHLRSALGDVECWEVENDKTYQFRKDGGVRQLADIVVKAKVYWWNNDDTLFDKWDDKSYTRNWPRATTSATATASGTRHSDWRQGETVSETDFDYTEAAQDAKSIYEDAAQEMGFMSVADLMNGMEFDNRFDAYNYIDNYYGDRRNLGY